MRDNSHRQFFIIANLFLFFLTGGDIHPCPPSLATPLMPERGGAGERAYKATKEGQRVEKEAERNLQKQQETEVKKEADQQRSAAQS